MESVDVAIVGAGLAGLTTARNLVRAGRSVVVLEGNDRVGGRTASERLGHATFDIGGQWIGPQQRRMTRLAAELGAATFPTYDTGRKVLDVDGRISTYTGAIPSLPPAALVIMQTAIWRIDRMAARIPAEDPWNAPGATRLDARTLASWMRSAIPSTTVRGAMTAAVRVIFGAEPSELSLLHALWYIGQGGGILKLVEIRDAAQESRFVHSAHSVSVALAGALGDRVRLSNPVTCIAQHDDGVVVTTGGDTDAQVRARRVVATAPPHMASRIRYEPGLPPQRDAMMQRIPMGGTIKFHALYDVPFWREAGFSGEMVCTSGPVSVVFDNCSHDGAQAALVGFCVGAAAREIGRLPEAAQQGVFEDVLVRGFGPRAREHTLFRIKDWAADEWSRGCPTGIMPPGVMGLYAPALRVPCGRIHWAGTETAREWTGYMEGAVESGERAAREVDAALGRDAVGQTARYAVTRQHPAQIGADLTSNLTPEETAWLDADLG
ncbi:MAG: monoamine oxidase [Actinomycetota bacterium]|nr:monoamine oxidase [Actinomycetota bacterium]